MNINYFSVWGGLIVFFLAPNNFTKVEIFKLLFPLIRKPRLLLILTTLRHQSNNTIPSPHNPTDHR